MRCESTAADAHGPRGITLHCVAGGPRRRPRAMGEEVVNEEFELECAPQFLSSGVPRHLWSEAYRKLSEEAS